MAAKPEDIDAYYLSLGRFTQTWAQVEAILAVLLRLVSGVDQKVAPAIFSGTRADQAKNFVKRILAARGEELDPVLKRAFDQFGTINSTRNDIVHYGAQFEEDEPIVSNYLAAHTPEALRRHSVPPKTLDAMNQDLGTIQAAVAYYLLKDSPSDVLPAREQIRQIALAPWRYKSPQQPPRHQDSPETHQER